MNLLKSKSKQATYGRKRKRYEVFDAGMPSDVRMLEETKEEKPVSDNDGSYADVTHTLKRQARGRSKNR